MPRNVSAELKDSKSSTIEASFLFRFLNQTNVGRVFSSIFSDLEYCIGLTVFVPCQRLRSYFTHPNYPIKQYIALENHHFKKAKIMNHKSSIYHVYQFSMAMLHNFTCCYTTWGVEIDNSPGYQDEGESSKVENGGAFWAPGAPWGRSLMIMKWLGSWRRDATRWEF